MKSGRESGIFTRLRAPSPHPWSMSSSAKVLFLFLELASGERDASERVVDGRSLGLKYS